MTDPGKNAPGLIGFPTPNNPADIESYLLFYFPDETWAQWVLGALKPMVTGFNWYESGEMSVDEAAEAFRLIIQEAPYNLIDPTVPTPWWDEDSADDTDDEAPKEDQPWYGQIVIIDDNLTFVENAFIWVVAGFIAYAGLPGAALSFVPIARKFVVTVKGNPLGGIIRFFADAVAIGEVDTYSPTDTAMDVPLMLPESMGFMAESAPVFWAQLLPDNPHELASVSATIVRSRLSENDYSPSSLRYNSDCDCVQYSPDGGETWIDDPSDDPRSSPKFLKPLKTGSDIRCRSAASMVMWLRNFIEYERDLLTAGAEITALSNAAFALFDILAPWAVLVQLLVDAAGTLFGIGSAALTAAFTETEWDALLCILFCNIGSDGSVNDLRMTVIQTQITADLNTTAALVLNLILSTQGVVGLQNAGVLYEVEDADCSDCECGWCNHQDDTSGFDEWDAETWPGGSSPPTWTGTAWQDAIVSPRVSYVWVSKTFSATEITDAALYSSLGTTGSIWVNGDGSLFSGTKIWESGFYISGSYTGITRLDLVVATVDAGMPAFTLDAAQFSGIGDSPFGENNC